MSSLSSESSESSSSFVLVGSIILFCHHCSVFEISSFFSFFFQFILKFLYFFLILVFQELLYHILLIFLFDFFFISQKFSLAFLLCLFYFVCNSFFFRYVFCFHFVFRVLEKGFHEVYLFVIRIIGILSEQHLPVGSYFICSRILDDYIIQPIIIRSLSSFNTVYLDMVCLTAILIMFIRTIVLQNEVGAAVIKRMHRTEGLKFELFLSYYFIFQFYCFKIRGLSEF